MEPLTSPRGPYWPLGASERARSPSPGIPAGAIVRGVSPSRFPPLGPVMTSPRSQGQLMSLSALGQNYDVNERDQ